MYTKNRVYNLVAFIVAVIGVILSVGYNAKRDSTRASVTPLKFEPTAARLERGRYIVEGPAHCFQCHSEVNWEKPGAQPKPEKKGAGTIFT